jgi:hypothetical protein
MVSTLSLVLTVNAVVSLSIYRSYATETFIDTIQGCSFVYFGVLGLHSATGAVLGVW